MMKTFFKKMMYVLVIGICLTLLISGSVSLLNIIGKNLIFDVFAVDTVDATSIKITNAVSTMKVGETRTLTTQISPSNTTNKTLTWYSSNSNVMTVDQNGKITAKKTGTVDIRVMTINGKVATATIEVISKSKNIEPTSVKIADAPKNGYTIKVGDSLSLRPQVSPSNATVTSATWSSSKTSVATVDKNGNVKAKSVGTTTISVKIGKLKASVNVTVKAKSTSKSIKSVKIKNLPTKKNVDVAYMKAGASATVELEINPTKATYSKIIWTSDTNAHLISITQDKNNPKKATIKTKGNSSGYTTVKAIVYDSNNKRLASTYEYILVGDLISDIKFTNVPTQIDMITGDTYALGKATTFSPTQVADRQIEYSSSNKKVATIDNTGKITAVGTGTARIVAKAAQGGKSSSVTVKVTDAYISFDKKNVVVTDDAVTVTATVKSNKKVSAKDVVIDNPYDIYVDIQKGNIVNNKMNVTIKPVYKNYGINVKSQTVGISASLKNNGKTVSTDNAKVKIVSKGQDKTLDCPNITYSGANTSSVTLGVTPDSKISYWEYQVSKNGKSGSKAQWSTATKYSGSQSIKMSSSDVQGRITVYSETGTSRYCYTAPFDYVSYIDFDSKDTNTSEQNTAIDTAKSTRYNNRKNNLSKGSATLPTISEVSKVTVKSANRYNMKMGEYDTTTGIYSAKLKINPSKDAGSSYQYTVLKSVNAKYGKYGYDANYTGVTYTPRSSYDLELSSEWTNFVQGIVLVIDEKGDINTSFSKIYSPLNFTQKKVINGVYVYQEKGYTNDYMMNYLSNLPAYYMAASQILLLSQDTYATIIGGGAGVTGTVNRQITVKSDNSGPSNYYKKSIVHELGHTMDSMYSYYISNPKYKRIHDQSDVLKMYNTYKVKYKTDQNGNVLYNNDKTPKHQYLTDYAYNDAKVDFWAELVGYSYVNENKVYDSGVVIDSELKKLKNTYLQYVRNFYNNNKDLWLSANDRWN